MGEALKPPPETKCINVRDCLNRGLSRTICFEAWEPPEGYDWSRSTRDNYTIAPHATQLQQHGPFEDIRQSLDLQYHGCYTKARQHFQDVLIQDCIHAATSKVHPWIVFTAGAMGAGKSHTITWMSSQRYFPLPDIVCLDPDVFKLAFPEWDGYLKHDPTTAGAMTRRESGMLVEIAQEAAMREQKNIWVDGSFRDCEWYSVVFDKIRKNHPAYRIAILYVYADPAEVKERARQRALATGRVVPIAEIEDSLRRVPIAVNRLARKADFIAHIDNTAEEPSLTDFCDRNGCFVNQAGSWEEVSNRFATLPALKESAQQWQSFVVATVQSDSVVLFSKTYCSYCRKLKALLQQLGVSCRVLELDLLTGNGAYVQVELAKMTGVWTVPQLFAFKKFVGDCSRALALANEGKLLPMLRGEQLNCGRGQEQAVEIPA